MEGQWVFGGIEEDSRKCFIVTVEDRSEKTLLKHIQEWIEPGTTIVSDRWKAYSNLAKYGYIHKTVNHSIEFVKSREIRHKQTRRTLEADEKVHLPTHGRK